MTRTVARWARSQPLSKEARVLAIEVGFIFDERDGEEWIEISDEDLAVRCDKATRTVWKFRGELAKVFETDRSNGKTTRYRRSSVEQLTYAPGAKVPASLSLSPSLSQESKSGGKEREAETSAIFAKVPGSRVPRPEQLLIPEVFTYAREERGFDETQTKFVIDKLCLHYEADGIPPAKLISTAKKWILSERINNNERSHGDVRHSPVSTGAERERRTQEAIRSARENLDRFGGDVPE